MAADGGLAIDPFPGNPTPGPKDISHDTRGDLFTFPTWLVLAVAAYLLATKKGRR